MMVAPTCDLMSSPMMQVPAFSKRFCQYSSRAMKTGMQLTMAHPAARICSVYHLSLIHILVAFVPAAAAAVLLTGTVLLGFTQAVDSGLPAAARSAVESFAGQTASYAAALAALAVLLVWRRGLRPRDLGWRLPRPLGRLGWLPWLAIGVVGAVVALLVAQWLGSLATDLLPNSPNTCLLYTSRCV